MGKLVDTCRNCDWFEEAQGVGGGYGECRRYPPTTGDEGGRVFPEVYNTDWCGEWEPKADMRLVEPVKYKESDDE